MAVQPIGYEQTVDILTGPREIPADVTARAETMSDEGTPIVDIDRFSEFVTGLMVEEPNDPDA